MWFREKDLIHHKIEKVEDIKGYVLPHASTQYTGNIISHTLRFKPKLYFTKVCILFSPAASKPNIGRQFHEYYVVQKSFDYICKNIWHMKRDIQYIPFNIKKDNISVNLEDTLIIISADFSHFLPLKKAIPLENCAAHSILQKYLHTKCSDIIDTKNLFEKLYNIIPESWMFQWIGRTRSPGIKGVGYLSFLLRDSNIINIPDGIFVTAYDNKMRQRECLGIWFNKNNPYTNKKVRNKINDVIFKAKTTSRLTNGKYLSSPIYGYSISYLYEDSTKKFIRGWHGIKSDAFYLSDVFLENTFNNGKWISHYELTHNLVTEWPQDNNFNISETLEKLSQKSGNLNMGNSYNYTLYQNKVIHYKL